jgi:hypothetical protein
VTDEDAYGQTLATQKPKLDSLAFKVIGFLLAMYLLVFVALVVDSDVFGEKYIIVLIPARWHPLLTILFYPLIVLYALVKQRLLGF